MEARRPEPDVRVEREQRIEPVEREDFRYEPRFAQRRDLLHWGPVWVGLTTAFAAMIVLGLLALAMGLSTVNPAAPGGFTGPDGMAAGIAGIVAVLISFFFGGWMAGRVSSARGTFPGFAVGTMVWALGQVLLVIITAIGVGGLLSVFSAQFGSFGIPVRPGEVPSATGPAVTALIGTVLAWLVTVLGAIWGSSVRAPELGDY